MKRSVRRLLALAFSVAILVLVVAAAVWTGAVERWIGRELRVLAAAHLEPTFSFDDLSYRFPRTVILRGIRLTSPDPEAKTDAIDILVVESLTLSLAEIPWPERPFRMQRIDLSAPTVHLVRIGTGKDAAGLLGYSHLLKDESEPAPSSDRPPPKPSELFQVRSASIERGRIGYEARDGDASVMLIDGIDATLSIEPSDAGSYDLDFRLDHAPIFRTALKGRLLADDGRLEIARLSVSLDLARENDHYLTPRVQKFLSARDITGRLKLDARGLLDLDDSSSSRLEVDMELDDASFSAGDYGVVLDRVHSRISSTGDTVRLEKLAIDALGGHVAIRGSFELDDSLSGAFTYEGADPQIADLLRGAGDPKGEPRFSGLLAFSGTLRGPLAEIDRSARGGRHLTLSKARLARLPVLSTIDETLDRVAEAAMKREHTGHDVASFGFRLDGDHVEIRKLRMNGRWYGLRGHGNAYFDSRLDLAVEGGPVQRLENELDAAGDVLGEITESLLRARVTGTMGEPKVAIEILRHRPQL